MSACRSPTAPASLSSNPDAPYYEITYEATGDTPPTVSDMNKTYDILCKRLDHSGVTYAIHKSGNNEFMVEIWGDIDPASFASDLGRQGVLQFRDYLGNVVLDGSDVKNASAGSRDDFGDGKKHYTVELTLTSNGTIKFSDATKFAAQQSDENNYITIALDDDILMQPHVLSQITDGSVEITGEFDEACVKNLAAIINSDSLPMQLFTLSSGSGPQSDTAPATAQIPAASVNSLFAEGYTTSQDWKDDQGFTGTVALKTWVGVQGNGETMVHPADPYVKQMTTAVAPNIVIPAEQNSVCVIPFLLTVTNTTEADGFSTPIQFTVSGVQPSGADYSNAMDSYNPKAPKEGVFVYAGEGWVYPDYWDYINQIMRQWQSTKKGFSDNVYGYIAVGSYYSPANPNGDTEKILNQTGLTISVKNVYISLKMRSNGNGIELYNN